ncbi:MAG: DUF4349 domain-containing protein, partial [Bacteroidota bacterium]
NSSLATSVTDYGHADNLLEFQDSSDPTPPQSVSKENPNYSKASKIVKEGEMDIEVENLASAKTKIDALVSRCKGYYEKEILRNTKFSEGYSLKIRVPSTEFEELISGLESGEGQILSKNIRSKDVSEEYLDLEIRLENNRAYSQRYTEMLKKAETIKEMVHIQEKIRQIELQIDGNLGRMNFLDDRTKYSTLSIELTTKQEEYVAEVPSFFTQIKKAFQNGFAGVLSFIIVMANIWPIILILFLAWALRKRVFKWKGKRNSVVSE